jgi:3-oxo-5-alpha-steroid 4-dehydrogenase 3
MGIAHLSLGLLFYVFINIALWIEGTGMLVCGHELQTSSTTNAKMADEILSSTDFEPLAILEDLNDMTVWMSVIGFIAASTMQHRIHKYLSTLPSAPNYTFPTAWFFDPCMTPHYTAEVYIYSCLCLISGSRTVWLAAVFVCVNLGVTADGTRQWYAQKFGEAKVDGKYRLIPKVW